MKENRLIDRLKEYSRSDFYPFHMPGHKRQIENGVGAEFPAPFSIDITEIDGFDNLHHAEGILRESMEWAASVYGADKTYYLINGSSCGILSAISGCVVAGGKILVSRNCHKSVYNGIFLNHLESEYIYPQFIDNFGITGGLSANDVDNLLARYPEIQAVLVVSPTYEGIVSDIAAIADAAHRHNVPLIVDEAHGAHFRYGKDLPVSALELGADVVIQSVHKTLPSLTQTALLHVKEGYADVEKIERYLHIYKSSSPSYVLMAGIENCIRYMEGSGKQAEQTERMQAELSGRERMEMLLEKVKKLRAELSQMKNLSILGPEVIGEAGVYDLDLTKLIILTGGTDLTGARLERILRERYHLEMEMCTDNYVTAILSVMDTDEGIGRLRDALLEIDGELCGQKSTEGRLDTAAFLPDIRMTIYEAVNKEKETVALADSAGRISGEYVYIYPPGIPIAAPGEVLKQEIIDTVLRYREMGLAVQGLKDESLRTIDVIEERKPWEK